MSWRITAVLLTAIVGCGGGAPDLGTSSPSLLATTAIEIPVDSFTGGPIVAAAMVVNQSATRVYVGRSGSRDQRRRNLFVARFAADGTPIGLPDAYAQDAWPDRLCDGDASSTQALLLDEGHARLYVASSPVFSTTSTCTP